MADDKTPKASDLLITYGRALLAGGLHEDLVRDIVRDAAEKLHSGQCALVVGDQPGELA